MSTKSIKANLSHIVKYDTQMNIFTVYIISAILLIRGIFLQRISKPTKQSQVKVHMTQLKGDQNKTGDFSGFEHWWKHFE